MKMGRIVLGIMLGFQLLWSLNLTGVEKSEAVKEVRDLIEKNKFFKGGYEVEEKVCEPVCRIINVEQFKSKITDFDANTGITTCLVYSEFGPAFDGIFNLNASTKNLKCQELLAKQKVPLDSNTLASNKDVGADEKTQGRRDLSQKIEPYKREQITMSRFIGGLATLDTDIIDLTETSKIQMLQRTSTADKAIYQLDDQIKADGTHMSSPMNTIINSLSESNMAYYTLLFYDLDNIYEYIVGTVFVGVALFFVLLFGSKMLLKKLEKKSTAFEEGWQTKVSVVIVSLGFFFMPMRFDANYSSTAFQNMWKFFVQESSMIADEANNIAASTLIRGTFSTASLSGVQEEAAIATLQGEANVLQKAYKNYINNQCKMRFKGEMSFHSSSASHIMHLESLKAPKKYEHISYASCQKVEQKYMYAMTSMERYKDMLDAIALSYSTDEGLLSRLSAQAEMLNLRVRDLGWYSAIIAPSIPIVTKISLALKDEKDKKTNASHKLQEKDISAISGDTVSLDYANFSKVNLNEQLKDDKISQRMGESLGTFIYYILPGVGHMNRTMQGLGQDVVQTLSEGMGFFDGGREKEAINSLSNIIHMKEKEETIAKADSCKNDENTKKATAKKPDPEAGKISTHFMLVAVIKQLLVYLPLLVAIVAGIVAVVVYLYELIVFSFITPFIVAFSVTTSQGRKILDFLVLALTIFVKPVLIVIFVYLSVFMYNFIENFMTVMVNNQLDMLAAQSYQISMSFMIIFIKELLVIMIVVFSSMFIWRVITGGPSFTFKMIGLDKVDNTSQLASGVQQGMGRYGFRV